VSTRGFSVRSRRGGAGQRWARTGARCLRRSNSSRRLWTDDGARGANGQVRKEDTCAPLPSHPPRLPVTPSRCSVRLYAVVSDTTAVCCTVVAIVYRAPHLYTVPSWPSYTVHHICILYRVDNTFSTAAARVGTNKHDPCPLMYLSFACVSLPLTSVCCLYYLPSTVSRFLRGRLLLTNIGLYLLPPSFYHFLR
jgi:hypothetical protein